MHHCQTYRCLQIITVLRVAAEVVICLLSGLPGESDKRGSDASGRVNQGEQTHKSESHVPEDISVSTASGDGFSKLLGSKAFIFTVVWGLAMGYFGSNSDWLNGSC